VQAGVTKQADVSLFGVGSQLSVTFHSSGDTNDTGTYPFTADNARIRMVDVGDVEILSIYSGGTIDTNDGSLFVGDSLPAGFPGSQDNVFVGMGIAPNVTSDAITNTGVGSGVFGRGSSGLSSGSGNTAIGYAAGQSIEDGIQNTVIGEATDVLAPSATGITLVGAQTDSGTSATQNATAIGYLCTVTGSNTALIGNDAVTDAFFGGETGNAILHGKGDAIVFPDSDPHVAGAAYWVLGVLTKSAG
jgi:hypothetical protein